MDIRSRFCLYISFNELQHCGCRFANKGLYATFSSWHIDPWTHRSHGCLFAAVRSQEEHEIFEHEIFLNTNNSNNTNIFWHTDLTHGFFALDVWTRILRITRILFGTRISFFLHTDLTNLTDFEPSARCEWQLVGLLTRCGYWLIVVIDLLWLLTCCGYWLVMF